VILRRSGSFLKRSHAVWFSPSVKAMTGNEKDETFGMLYVGLYITSQTYKSGSTLKRDIASPSDRATSIPLKKIWRHCSCSSRNARLSDIQTVPIMSPFIWLSLSPLPLEAALPAISYKNNHDRNTSVIPQIKYLYMTYSLTKWEGVSIQFSENLLALFFAS
jgi:hypothetical protein